MRRWGVATLLALLLLSSFPGRSLAGAPGTVTIIKVNAATLAPLGGSCFRIMNSSLVELANVCDNGPGDVAPDAGAIVYDAGLPGVYYVQESQAPPGYTLNPGTFACDATGDLLCSAFVGNTAGAVGGIAAAPAVARAALESDRPPAPGVGDHSWRDAAAASVLAALVATALLARRRG